MTARDKMAAASRQNADSLGGGLPVLLMVLAREYAGIEIPLEVAGLAAGLLGSWGAKIRRRIDG